MTIKAAISQVKSDNKAFSDDSMLTNRFVWSKIQSKTLFFLKQRNDRFNLNNNNFLYSVLDCVEMEMVNSINCCKEIPACEILRSVEKLPKIAESNLTSIIKGIYNLDNSERIDFVSINDVIRLSNSKYKPKGIKAFIKDEYLFNRTVRINTRDGEVVAKIVSRVGDHILTSTNKKILLSDIISISEN